jgi:hypothetical protein
LRFKYNEKTRIEEIYIVNGQRRRTIEVVGFSHMIRKEDRRDLQCKSTKERTIEVIWHLNMTKK